MLKEFRVIRNDDIDLWVKEVEELKALAENMITGKIPDGKKYTRSELEEFCRSLVENQRLEDKSIEGSWFVGPSDFGAGIPSEPRVDLVYYPTYYAISILTKVMLDHPEVAESIPGYKKALKKGCDFSTRRGFFGHGFSGYGQMFDTIDMFHKSGLIGYVRENPDFSEAMTKTMRDVRTELSNRIESGDTIAGWNSDYSEPFRKIIGMIGEI